MVRKDAREGLMNGPFVVAQANSGASSATPVQVIRLIKPQARKTDIFHASFTGTVQIDFTAIANEKIVLYHDSKNQSLHIIFVDGSQIVVEPFFDSRGTILANFILEMGPNQFYSGEEFAQKFTVTEDQSVLPAAGDGVAVQNSPLLSSRRYTTSDGGSTMGSLLQGVSRL